MRLLGCATVVSLAWRANASAPYVDGTSTVINMHGAGTTNPQRLFWESMDLLSERAKLPLHMTYRAVGSSTGQKEFVGDDASGYRAYNHFGAGDIPMTFDRYTETKSHGRTMVHVPFAMGAIGVFHSVPSSELGGKPIDLTGCLLARIFSLDITHWEHEDIRVLNPSMSAVGKIKVYHRVQGSSSTAGFTQYLEGKCPEYWTLGSGSTITWPTGTFEGQGSGGMSDEIDANDYAIGYIDAGHGHERGFGEIALLNKANVYLTTLDANISDAAVPALAAGVIPADPTADFSSVNLYDQTGSATWPITMISYFYIDQDLSHLNADSASVLLAFVRYILSDEGQALAEINLFSRLPAELQTYTNATLNNITMPSGWTDFFIEASDNTQARLGANEYVLSGKRRSYAEYERSQLESQLSELSAQTADLSAQVAELSAQNSDLSAQNSDLENKVSDIELAAVIIAPVALVLAAVGVGLSIYNTIKASPIVTTTRTGTGNGNGGYPSVGSSISSVSMTSAGAEPAKVDGV